MQFLRGDVKKKSQILKRSDISVRATARQGLYTIRLRFHRAESTSSRVSAE